MDRFETRLNGGPELFVDNPKRRHLLGDPLRGRIGTREAFPCLGVLDVVLLVPDQPAGIEVIAQDARAAIVVAANGGVAPDFAEGARNALGVEPPGDGPRRGAGGELAEDAPDDRGLGFVDSASTSDRFAAGVVLECHVEAVTAPATGAALAHASFQAAPHLLAEVLQEERVHRALEPHMKL